MRKHLGTILKIGVTVIGLGYVLWQVPLAQVIQVLANISWPLFLIAVVINAASMFLRAYRWLILLRSLDALVGFWRLLELYYVGNFFNAFLPSGFGGDAVRILEASKDAPADVAAGTVIVDRLTGLLMLLALALLALPFRPAGFPDQLALAIFVFSIGGLIAGFVLLDGRLIRRFGGWLPSILSPVGDGPVAKVLKAVQGCGWKTIGIALLISAVFNLLLAAWWAVTGLALGFDIPYTYYLLVVPIMSVALLVPSIGGLGVREYLAPLLFAGAGLSSAEAVALSLLVFVVMRLVSLLGGPVYIVSTLRESRKRSPEPESVQNQEPRYP
jgi:uncharacterized membrane protein YbhN (UPF0104 family)